MPIFTLIVCACMCMYMCIHVCACVYVVTRVCGVAGREYGEGFFLILFFKGDGRREPR